MYKTVNACNFVLVQHYNYYLLSPKITNIPSFFFYLGSAGTDKMYTLISALHALNNNTTTTDDMYVGECQDSSNFNQDLVQGNLLICSYSIRFVLGLSTIKQAFETAKNLSAAGIVFYMDPFVIGFQLNPTPMKMPGIIIPSPDDSKVQFVSVVQTTLIVLLYDFIF